MKKFISMILILNILIFSCGGDSSSDEFVSSSNIYEMSDVSLRLTGVFHNQLDQLQH